MQLWISSVGEKGYFENGHMAIMRLFFFSFCIMSLHWLFLSLI